MKLTYICFLIAFSFHANADTANELALCSQINNEKERLECFDTIQQKLANKPLPETPVAERVQPVKSEIIEVSEQNPPLPVLTNTAPSSAITESAESPKTMMLTVEKQTENFGKKLTDANIITKINSKIDGVFKGWVNDQVITLVNGQKWKVISRSKGYVKLTNPDIEISEGILGSYDMRIDGFNPVGKVRRIN